MATGFMARSTEKEFFWESPEQGHNNRIGRCHHRLWNQLQLEHAMATYFAEPVHSSSQHVGEWNPARSILKLFSFCVYKSGA